MVDAGLPIENSKVKMNFRCLRYVKKPCGKTPLDQNGNNKIYTILGGILLNIGIFMSVLYM